MRPVGVLVGFFLVLVACQVALAQVITETGAPISGVSDPYLDSFRPFNKFVACADLQPLRRPGGAIPAYPDKLSFLQTVRVIQQTRLQGQTYYLISTGSGGLRKVAGWIDARLCISDDARLVPGKGLRQKCILTNRVEAFGQDDVNLIDVPVFSRPDLPTDKLANYKLKTFEVNNLFFIYSRYENFVLVGSAAAIRSAKNPQDVIEGWVAQERVAEWNTREGFEWATDTFPSRRQPAVIYSSGDAAHKHLQNPDSDLKEVSALFIEPIDEETGRAMPWPKYNDMRFPLLGKPPAETPVNTLYKLGGLVGNQSLAKLINGVRASAKQVDILVIVDDSQGMDAFFPAVAESMKAILDDFSEAVSSPPESDYYRDVQVAVAYYADLQHSTPPAIKPSKLLPITDKAQFDYLLGEVRRHQHNGGGDLRESVFDGIAKCLDNARFRPRSRRLVVVIGDEGDKRDVGTTDFNRATSALAKRMVPPGNRLPCDFLAICVKSADKGADSNSFANHMKELNQAIRRQQKAMHGTEAAEMADLVEMPAGQLAKAEFSEKVKEKLMAKTQRFEVETAKYISWAREMAKGNRLSASRLGDTLKLLIASTAQGDITPGQDEVYRDGFAWKNSVHNNVPQLREMVLVRRSELRSIYGELSRFDVNDPRGSIETLTRELLESYSGDEQISSLNQYYLVKTGLSFTSPLFRYRKNDRQEISWAIPPTTGQVQLSMGPYTTEPISLGASAGDVQNAIDRISGIPDNYIKVLAGTQGTWIITFQEGADGAELPLVVAEGIGLPSEQSIRVSPSRDVPYRELRKLRIRLLILKDLLQEEPLQRNWKLARVNGKWVPQFNQAQNASDRWFTLLGDPNQDQYIWLDPEDELP